MASTVARFEPQLKGHPLCTGSRRWMAKIKEMASDGCWWWLGQNARLQWVPALPRES